MTIKDPKIGDLVENTRDCHIGKIVKVNDQFGWFKVEYFDKSTRIYQQSTKGTDQFRRLTKEEKADFLLKIEKAGITDAWLE